MPARAGVSARTRWAQRMVCRRSGHRARRQPTHQARAQEHRRDAQLRHGRLAQPRLVVYDGDASDTASTGSTGSGAVEDVFVDFSSSIGLPTEPTAFDGRSDYDAFVAAGTPAGGLFTGAEDIMTVEQTDKWHGTPGVAFDPCYHQATRHLY